MARAIPGVLAALLVLGTALVAGQGPGEGLGLSPPRIDLPDAQPGQTYLRTVQVQNPSSTPSGIGIQRSGEVAAWTKTDPAGNFTIPARSVREVALSIAVPSNAALGDHAGQLTFIADPKEAPDGSGASFRPAVGLLLNFTVGGEAVTRLTWLDGRADDAESGQPVPAFVTVRNDGNVRATAEATADAHRFDGGGPVLSQASGSLEVLPGETAEVPLQFPAGLPVGQYLARLAAKDGAFEAEDEFKVLPPGGQAPDGLLRAIVHVPFGKAGQPVRLDAWFENTGNLTIRSAAFHGEVHRGDALLATVESQALVVEAGRHANLTAYWTPTKAGTYVVSGHVTYDGYQSLPTESLLNVKDAAGGAFPWWWILVALLVLAAGFGIWAWRSDRRKPRA